MISFTPAAAQPPAAAPAVRTPRRQLVRKRFWLLLAMALLVCLPFYPPAWHAALRTWLVWQARRHGCELTITAIDGGIFDTTRLRGMRCRQHRPQLPGSPAATDIFIARADLTLAWTVPWVQRAAPSWVRAIVLDGVRGRWDLHELGRAPASPPPTRLGTAGAQGFDAAVVHGDVFARALGAVLPSLRRFSARLVPETFLLRAEDLRLERGRYFLHAAGLRLSGSRDDDGQFLARELTIAGPGFENTLLRSHGQTYWKDSRLTFSQLTLGPDVSLVSATLDGSHLNRHRLNWEYTLTALGGEVRGQGAIDFSHERLALEVAASLRGTALRPLARLLGVAGPVDGLIDQGNFTFRGDPENWPAAQMWLAAHATDFRWGKRRWQDLELQAVVVDRRVQIHRLELRQSANHVSLTGECPLPPGPAEVRDAADALRRWREGGFNCQVDARLEDLHALADLFGPQSPELAGRMSVNGALSAQPGAQQAVDGYLNVEGSRLSLRGAPLDFLRSTLVFKDGGVRVADLQATRDGDYFTGTGSMRLDGPSHYEGQLRAEVKRLAVYAPAFAGLPLGESLARVTGLNAQLGWDDSVLHFDECQGQFDGASCRVGGTVDLHDTAHPLMDLSLRGENLALRAAAGPGRVQANCALTVRGRLGGAPQLGGEIHLLGGELGAALELVPRFGADFRPFYHLETWLPDQGAGWNLDLHVMTAAPILLARGGEARLDLHVTTEAYSAPALSGTMDVRQGNLASPDGELTALRGTIYFARDFPSWPRASLVAVDPQGGEIMLGGAYDSTRTTVGPGRLPIIDERETGVLLRQEALPTLWVADASPWIAWPGIQTEPQETVLLLR